MLVRAYEMQGNIRLVICVCIRKNCEKEYANKKDPISSKFGSTKNRRDRIYYKNVNGDRTKILSLNKINESLIYACLLSKPIQIRQSHYQREEPNCIQCNLSIFSHVVR